MSTVRVAIVLVGAAALGAAGAGLYGQVKDRAMQMPEPATAAPSVGVDAAPVDPSVWGIAQGEAATRRHIEQGLRAGAIDPVTGRAILHYHDPMVPGRKFDAPGKSPFMDMMLVPAYAGPAGADSGTISISPRIAQNLGVRTAVVSEGELAPVISAVGTIAWNERAQVIVQARAAGYVEKLHVRATLDRVLAGQPLLELHVPDWVAAQEDFFAVRGMAGRDLAVLVDAARERMRQAGMDATQIRHVERSGKVMARTTVRAPIGGVLIEIGAREGMTVMPGTTLVRINALDPVWAHAEVPESQMASLRAGAPVAAHSPAFPDERFEGQVQALLPQVDPATRTIKVRMEIANADGRLVPGMFVRMQMGQDRPRSVLQVPSEAVIHTGKRALVMVAEADGRFRPVEVAVGVEAGGMSEITRGLQAGQRVVLSGQFLIDSEASLKAVEARLSEPSGAAASPENAPAPAAPETHRTDARVEALGAETVTLSHPEVPSLQWPAMTMDFRLASGLDTAALAPGQRVTVEFQVQAGDVPRIVAIKPVPAATQERR